VSFFSRPGGTWLARRFGPKITVVVSATAVEFRRETWSVSFEPALFVRDGVVVSVGAPTAVPSERLPVFSGEESDRTARIGKFMQHGLREAIGHKLSIRPVVQVAFDPAVVSEAELRRALLKAGAAEVTFSGKASDNLTPGTFDSILKQAGLKK
jgi:hypothetical protein